MTIRSKCFPSANSKAAFSATTLAYCAGLFESEVSSFQSFSVKIYELSLLYDATVPHVVVYITLFTDSSLSADFKTFNVV